MIPSSLSQTLHQSIKKTLVGIYINIIQIQREDDKQAQETFLECTLNMITRLIKNNSIRMLINVYIHREREGEWREKRTTLNKEVPWCII